MEEKKTATKPADDGDIDLDLDAEDALLREAVGKPYRIKVRGMVVEIQNQAMWTTRAMDAIDDAHWLIWAEETIEDEVQRKAFDAGSMRNYQMQALFSKFGALSGMTPGK